MRQSRDRSTRTIRPVIISCLAVLLAFASCNPSRKQIVGKWKAAGGSNEVAWEFFDNGTLSSSGSPGRYSFDNQRIKIQTSTAIFVYQLEFQGDRMIWKEPNGSTMELTKIK